MGDTDMNSENTSGESKQERDSYEDQLRSLFISCASEGSDTLQEDALRLLCRKLELPETQTHSLILRLLRADSAVTFYQFRDVLVSFLAEREKREVEPKVVIRNKAYGRKSRPNSLDISDDEEKESKEITSESEVTTTSSLESDSMNANFIYKTNNTENNEEEYLKEIWEKLGVGRDGFLDRNELSIVCQCIGMEKLPDEVVDQLFLKLDLDNDGRVAFEDLLSLFQSSRALWTTNSCSSSSIDEVNQNAYSTVSKESEDSTPSLPSKTSRVRRNALHSSPINESLKKANEVQYFTAIESDAGTCGFDVLLEYWESLGINNGQAILRDLGLLTSFSSTAGSHHHARIDLSYLSALLESELEQCKDLITFPSAKAAITTVQKEARHVRSNLENTRFERDKLRSDLNDSNSRASILAQEIDDQNARLEKNSRLQIEQLELRYNEQIKEIQGLLSKEREQQQSLIRDCEVKDNFFQERLLEQEGRLKEKISHLLSENERLERENIALGNRLNESESLQSSLQKEIEKLSEMKERLTELESQVSDSNQITQLLREIEQLKTINKDLKDQNDELYSQLEMNGSKSDRRGSSSSLSSSSFDEKTYQPKYPSSSSSESIGVEILDCPSVKGGGSSSLESIEDSFVSGIIPDSADCSNLSEDIFEVSSLRQRVQECRKQLRVSESQNRKKVGALIQKYEKDLSNLKESNLKLKNEKTNLEEIQLRTNSMNKTLTKEMVKVESEMTNVQNRLQVALSTLDHCKSKQSNDEERINVLTAKCSKLEDRLRESLSLPPSSSMSGPPSSSTSSENIQIISIRNNGSTSSTASDSVTTSPSPSRHSASPCVSKILLNSTDNHLYLDEDSSSANCSPVAKRQLRRSPDLLTSSSSIFRHIQNHFKNSGNGTTVNVNAIKRSRSTTENEQRSKSQVFQLEQHCKNLEGELDHVKDEILKILSAKSTASKENENLKRYAQAYEELVRENEALKKEVIELKNTNVRVVPSPSPQTTTTHDRSSPDGQEHYESSPSTLSSSSEDTTEVKRVVKKEFDNEKNVLIEKIAELEESMDLMKNEFENMEDYWQEKLEKERQFYENQLSLSDSNFKELEIKMKEYEELMMMTPPDGMNTDPDKLSTIAESVSLECQVTELEEELSAAKERLKETKLQKEKEISEVKLAWESKLKAEKETFFKEKQVYQEKILQLQSSLENANSNRSKAASDHRSVQEQYKRDISLLQNSYLQIQEQLRRSKSVSPLPPASKLRLLDVPSAGSRINSKTSAGNGNKNLSRLIHPPALPRYCNQSGSMSLDASFRFSDHNNSLSKQSSPSLTTPSGYTEDSLDSVANAYQTVVRDISKEKNFIQNELDKLKNRPASKKDNMATFITKMWKPRIEHQEQRCQQLKASLLQQQTQYRKILKATRDQHEEALKNLETLMTANENVLKNNAVKYGEQLERLIQSELLVKSLLTENDSLVSAFQNLLKNNFVQSQILLTQNGTNKFNLIKSFSVAITSSSSNNNEE